MSGFLIFIVMAGLVAALVTQATRLTQIRRDMQEMKHHLGYLHREVQQLQANPITTPDPFARATPLVSPGSVAGQVVVPAPAPWSVPAARVPVAPPISPYAQPAQPSAPQQPSGQRWSDTFESLVGEKLLNWVGALALIVGVGFFLKYAFDRDWIGPSLRVAMGAVLGLSLVVIASRQRVRYAVFAQALIGAGISILYLSVYASHNIYHLEAGWVALLSMSVITVLTFERGLKFDSLGLALFGWLGGFLTPLLLGGGGGATPAGFFGYLLLLNAALVGLAMRREAWWVLEPLAIAGTYLNFVLWFRFYQDGYFIETAIFLTALWAMFLALDVYWLRAGHERENIPRAISESINSVFYYGAIAAIVHATHPGTFAIWTIAMAAVYSLASVAAGRPIMRHLVRALALVMTATILKFDGFLVVGLWAAESLAALLVGIGLRKHGLRVASVLAFGVTLLGLLTVPGSIDYIPIHIGPPLANLRTLMYLVVGGAMGLGAWACGSIKIREDDEDSVWMRPILNYGWAVVGFALVTVEAMDAFDRSGAGLTDASLYSRGLVLAAVWVTYGLALAALARWIRTPSIFHAALGTMGWGLLATAASGLTYVPIEKFTPVVNPRFALMLASMGAAYAVSVLCDKDVQWQSQVSNALKAAIAILSFELVTIETWDWFARKISAGGRSDGGVFDLRSQRQLAVSSVWLMYSSVAMAVGIWRRWRTFRITAISLLSLTVLKVFLYDLSFLRDFDRIFSFMGLGVILLAASFAYNRFKPLIFGQDESISVRT